MAEMIKESKNSIYNTVTKNRLVLWRQANPFQLCGLGHVSVK